MQADELLGKRVYLYDNCKGTKSGDNGDVHNVYMISALF